MTKKYLCMPKLGAHMSIAKGLHLAFDRGHATGCQTMQIFLRNSNQWQAPPLKDSDINIFKQKQAASEITPVFAHEIYLVNLASPDNNIYDKSCQALWQDMRRAEDLGIPYLVFHPGAHTGNGETQGLKRIAQAINALLEKAKDFKLQLLLETTAGQGTVLGYRFEQLAEILAQVEQSERVGICLDTCHVFAAGYDLSTDKGYQKTWREFERVLGMKRLKLIHLNDSKRELGSRVDRHQHIGQGELGLDAFSRLLNDQRLQEVPMILETPKELNPDGEDMELINLEQLRNLCNNKSVRSEINEAERIQRTIN